MGMRVKVVGHACLEVRHEERTLLVDPWLSGSCYWRSWWHYPEPATEAGGLASPDAIYLSHEHFDHFHYPSMRRFERATPIYVPRFLRPRMLAAARALGFTDVREVAHGEPVALPGGLSLTSYQYGLDDTSMVISDGESTLLNLVDSKVTGPALRQILRRSAPIDLLLRSHAPAQAYPLCYQAEDPAELELRRRGDYLQMFVDTMRIVQPRFAVPFASNVCLLHRETEAFNDEVVTPLEVAAACARLELSGTELVVMSPGDTWSRERGFQLGSHAHFDDPRAAIARLAERAREKLAALYAEEESVRPDFERFRDYLTPLFSALPPGSRALFRPTIVFDQPLDSERYWIVDFAARAITRSRELPPGHSSLITIHPAVLMDAVGKSILNFVHISKRLRAKVRRGKMRDDLVFWLLVELWELGYLPLTRLFTPRAAQVLWSRRAEVFGHLRTLATPSRFEEKVTPRVY